MSLRTYFRLFTHTQLLPILESGEETLVGGQAVMEGVMMRAPHSYCVAVRKKNGELVTERMPMPRISEKYKIFKYPVIRGVGTLFQAMSLGMKALKFSADVAIEDEAAKAAEAAAAAAGSGAATAIATAASPKKERKEVPTWAMAINIIFSLGMFIVLNKLIPLSVATWLKSLYPSVFGHLALFNLADGLVRMSIFLVLMYALSLSKEFHRIFVPSTKSSSISNRASRSTSKTRSSSPRSIRAVAPASCSW